jgi:hypothetical protein
LKRHSNFWDGHPKNAVKPEQFAQALIPIRIRRDKERNESVKNIVAQLASGTNVPDDFAQAVRKAADEVRTEEQRQLTEYVLRRKMVLDVLDVLIRRVREKDDGPDDHHIAASRFLWSAHLAATRSSWNSAFVRVMSRSRLDAEAVTRSPGTSLSATSR